MRVNSTPTLLTIGAAVLAVAVLSMLVYAGSTPIGTRATTGLYTYAASFDCMPGAADPNDPNSDTATTLTAVTANFDAEDAHDCAFVVQTEYFAVDPNEDPNIATVTYTIQTSPKDDPNGTVWGDVKAWSARSSTGFDWEFTQRALFRYQHLKYVVADPNAVLTECGGTVYAECRQ